MSTPDRDSTCETEWPVGDGPDALRWWFEEDGESKLGSNLNKWLGFISYASSLIWSTPDETDRRAFREVALAAIEEGRRAKAIPDRLAIEREIYARMSYLRNSDASAAWQREEMGCVLDIFTRSLPMDIGCARNIVKSWRDQPVSVVKSLRFIKNLLGLMEPGECYLGDDVPAVLQDWLDLRPELP
jgi:hypothetical protein